MSLQAIVSKYQEMLITIFVSILVGSLLPLIGRKIFDKWTDRTAQQISAIVKAMEGEGASHVRKNIPRPECPVDCGCDETE
jgi:hypothetical protein